MSIKVKALEWEEIHQRRSDEDPTTEWNGGYEADSALGYYEISMGFGSDAYYWTVSDPLSKDIGSDFEDPSDAKAAAQANYERRIRSALEPAPSRTVTFLTEVFASGIRIDAGTYEITPVAREPLAAPAKEGM